MAAIGILALQGAFAEHAAMLDRLGAEHFEIRQRRDLERSMDGLILPGGESTAMKKLLDALDLFHPLQSRIQEGLPVFGTCAGLILLAQQVEGGTPCFGTMDITARRNAYGRQLGSFFAQVDGRIVAARLGNQLAAAFHPELSDDLSVHRYFLNML